MKRKIVFCGRALMGTTLSLNDPNTSITRTLAREILITADRVKAIGTDPK